MASGAANGQAPRQAQEAAARLESWKQIAAYLDRHMTTVRRWERSEGLPVHRHQHVKLGSIYAYPKELDAWLRRREHALPTDPPAPRLQKDTWLEPVPSKAVRLLGREAEVERLWEVWRGARSGKQELVFITGEPGTGKTRLVSEFATTIGGNATVLAGRCDRPPHLPFAPFAELLGQIRRSVPAEVLQQSLANIDGSAELLHLAPEFSKLIRPRAARVQTTLEGHRFRLFEAFAQLIRALAETTPVLLVVDDVGWADEASLLLLRYLVRSTREIACCIVLTCCEAELAPASGAAELLGGLRRETAATQIELSCLTSDATERLVKEWMGGAAPASLSRFIDETTGGNPFFATEMLQHLSEVERSPQASGNDLPVAGLSLPRSIRELTERRLARLSETCRRLLIVTAVAGSELRLTIAEEVTELSESVLLDALEEGVAAGILQERPGARGFHFTHPLLPDALYSAQSHERRVRLHHRLAGAIERHSHRGDLPVAQLAFHFGRAAGYADAEKAVRYAVLAAEQATVGLATEEAAHCYRLALDAMEFLPRSVENGRLRRDLHARRARSFADAGQWAWAKKDWEVALTLTSRDETERLAELHGSLAETSFWLLDIPGVREYAGQAQRWADLAGRADLSADALAWKASAQVADGDVLTAIESDRKAVARAGGIRSFALARVPLTLYWAGQTAAAAEQACQAVECARRSGNAAFLLYALQHQGLGLTGLGEYDRAFAAFEEACAFGKRCGALPLVARALSMSTAPLLCLRDLEGARRRALEARELAHRASFEPPLVSSGIDLLLIEARFDRPGETETLLRETQAAVARAGGWHGWKWRLRLQQAQAELALARGNCREAIVSTSRVVEASRRYHRPKYEALALVTRARAAGRLGLRSCNADARAAVEVARRLDDPAILLECVSVLLGLDGSDELESEAHRIVLRMAGRISEEAGRRRFLDNLAPALQASALR